MKKLLKFLKKMIMWSIMPRIMKLEKGMMKGKVKVTIRTSFKPEKVVVDPNVRVLQLRRKSAEAKL